MFKKYLISLAFSSMALLSGVAIANDATTSSPPSVTMSSSSVPAPPVCNITTQKLHWTGSAWQCQPVGNASYAASAGSVSGLAKGSIAGFVTGHYGCPGGTTKHLMGATEGMCGGASLSMCTTYRYMCVKN